MDDLGYQTVQSEAGMAAGSLVGVGIGAGRAKHVMPAATTDFIMATISEETGLLGSLVVIGVIGLIVSRLWSLSRRSEDQFSSLVLGGTAAWIGIQTTVNVMMANGMLPAIGIPLPFISSGGSSLVALWAALGICQVVAPERVPVEARDEARTDGWRDRRTYLPGT
jgi:cell division protein FtsW